ncbi:MAG: ABC transporter permease [Planctomycetes bacterium]|nr:ABC transporter permease [Planctomycetota bacterium]
MSGLAVCERNADGVWTLCPSADALSEEAGDAAALSAVVPAEATGRVVIDLRGAGALQTLGVVLLQRCVKTLEARGLEVRLKADADQGRILGALGGVVPEPLVADRSRGLDRVLRGLLSLHEAAIESAWLLRNTLKHSLIQTLRPRGRDDGRMLSQITQIGFDAIPLVALISSMLGLILALQSAPILRMWGQELRVADLVGLSMCKEIGPLLTAVLVAGRSGSALAAEIGTMKLNDELDAMTVMGVDPVGVLVAPRMRAMLLALPLVTLMGDVLGMMGGFFIGTTVLDIAPQQYINQTLEQVPINDVFGGLVKAALFGIVIVTVSAWQGFAASGGASGVGRSTTRSVVYSILWIIVVDAIYTAVDTSLAL